MSTGTRKTILLVEDEAIIALSEKTALEKYGYAVRTVISGEKAIEAVRTNHDIDLVLMDINLGSGIDGTEAAEIILEDNDIPIVFVSSHSEREIVEKTEKITSYGYVVKNSSITVLDASIKMAFKLFDEKERFKAVNDKLEATFEALPDLIFEIGLDGYYYNSHSTRHELFYKPIDELVGRKIPDVLPPDVSGTIMCAVAEANEKGISQGKQYDLKVPAGMRTFEITVSRIASFSGRPRFILLCRDVTERKKVEEALEKRMILLTSPLENSDTISFTDLFNLEDIQKLQDDFSNATGLASIITQIDGTPITAPSNFCRLCNDIIRKSKIGNLNCRKSDAILGRMNIKEPIIRTCLSGGLWDAGAGISIGGKHIANWLIGQVRDETQTVENMREYARKIGSDEESFVAAFNDVPSMKREKFDQFAHLLFRLANQLSTLAYQNVQQARMIAERKKAEDALRASRETAVIRDANGLPLGLFSSGEDVAQRKLMEAELAESEERFKEILQDHPALAVQGYGTDGVTCYWNKAAEKLYGYTAQEALGRNLLDLIIPVEMRQQVARDIKKMVDTEIAIPASELVLKKKDGSRIDVFSSHAILRSSRHAPELFCFDIDISERKESERKLRDSEQKYRLLAEHSADVIWVLSLETERFKYISPSILQLRGLTPEEAMAETLEDSLTPESLEVVKKTIASDYEYFIEYPDNPRSNCTEIQQRCKNGDIIWVEVSTVYYRNEDGDIEVIGTSRNIEERKKAEQELKKSESLVKALLAEKELILKEVSVNNSA